MRASPGARWGARQRWCLVALNALLGLLALASWAWVSRLQGKVRAAKERLALHDGRAQACERMLVERLGPANSTNASLANDAVPLPPSPAGVATRAPPPAFLVYMTGQIRSFEWVAPMNARALSQFQGPGAPNYWVYMLPEEAFASAGHGVTESQVAKLPRSIVTDTISDPDKNPFLPRCTFKMNNGTVARRISNWDRQYEQWKRLHSFARHEMRRTGTEVPPHTPIVKTRFDSHLVEMPELAEVAKQLRSEPYTAWAFRAIHAGGFAESGVVTSLAAMDRITSLDLVVSSGNDAPEPNLQSSKRSVAAKSLCTGDA